LSVPFSNQFIHILPTDKTAQKYGFDLTVTAIDLNCTKVKDAHSKVQLKTHESHVTPLHFGSSRQFRELIANGIQFIKFPNCLSIKRMIPGCEYMIIDKINDPDII